MSLLPVSLTILVQFTIDKPRSLPWRVEYLKRAPLGQTLSLLANIRLGWKYCAETKTYLVSSSVTKMLKLIDTIREALLKGKDLYS
jgi:hypothetical protein